MRFVPNFKIPGQVVNEKSLTKISISIIYIAVRDRNQRTNGPVNAHLISWPSNTKPGKIYGKEMTLTFNTHIPS